MVRKVTPDDAERMAALRRLGATTRAVAREFGVHERTVHDNTAAFGPFPVLRHGKHLARKFTPGEDAEIARRLKIGQNIRLIACHLGRDPASVRYRIEWKGVGRQDANHG